MRLWDIPQGWTLILDIKDMEEVKGTLSAVYDVDRYYLAPNGLVYNVYRTGCESQFYCDPIPESMYRLAIAELVITWQAMRNGDPDDTQ